MKKIGIFFCLVLFTNTVFGKDGSTQDSLKIKTLLFKITNPKTQKTSYLFGTHHAFGKSFFDSLKSAKSALLSSEVLIKENLNIPGQMAKDIINNRKIKTNWKKYLSKPNLQFVQTLFSSSPTDYTKMTPTEMYVFLTRHYKERYCLAKDTVDSYLSFDDYIGTIAEKAGIKLAGLETTQEQIDLINKDVEGMPRRVHKKRLSALVAKFRSQSKGDCSEIEWYKKMEFDYKFNQPCQNMLLLTDRNDRWMILIKDYLETYNCFIAVGLSHLMYECGLISQLKREGYTVTPVEV